MNPTTPDMSGVNNFADIGKALKAQLDGNNQQPRPAAPPSAPEDKGKQDDGTRVPVSAEGLTPEEIALIKPEKPKGSEEDKPSTIAGTPFQSLDALADGYKNLQRRLQEVQDEAKNGFNEKVRAAARAELEAMLREVPTPEPQESEEEKTLKTEDPDAYRMLQHEKKIEALNGRIESLMSEIQGIHKKGQIASIQQEFAKEAERVKVPAQILMAYGSLPQFASTPTSEVAEAVKQIWEAEIRKYAPDLKPDNPAPAAPTGDYRPPASSSPAAVVSSGLSVEDIGVPGSKKFREFTQKKMAQIFAQRHAGGGGS